MTGESTARLSPNTLRRRMHILERASRSFTTADSSTRNGDVDDRSDDLPLPPSPPTSFDCGYEEDEEGEGVSSQEGTSNSRQATALATGAAEEDDSTPAPRPWYKPSIPVLLALAPPVGNWLTGGDHIKDFLLLLLLVFYLHQLVEVPWGLYHAARPRRAHPLAASGPATLAAARAQSELHTLELVLLVVCLLTPVLGVVLLRSLTSLATRDSSANPISWFSTTIFALLTGLRPLREFTSRLTARTSTLHAHVHAHTAPVLHSADATELAELRADVARLMAELEDRNAALLAHVDDALSPLEHDMRRLERRVGKLRAARKQGAPGTGPGSTAKTIFVPAQSKPAPSPAPTLLTWFARSPVPAPSPASQPPPISPSPSSSKRRVLASIPEEGEAGIATPYAPTPPPPMGHALLALLSGLVRQWSTLVQQCFAASVALALYPLYLVLLPVRGALRALLGAD
ncbi:hypothetical protein GGX14DRAFT_428147 [Mycena pura]|uniref:Uncharacterized protein n=1 Tax=Mycena pura TaxID=153505 RepID=A0AAD6YJG3_9AGAR|nr:hypothetical protein GGX14DRAFT_428147 [Mycena pura]